MGQLSLDENKEVRIRPLILSRLLQGADDSLGGCSCGITVSRVGYISSRRPTHNDRIDVIRAVSGTSIFLHFQKTVWAEPGKGTFQWLVCGRLLRTSSYLRIALTSKCRRYLYSVIFSSSTSPTFTFNCPRCTRHCSGRNLRRCEYF